MIQLRVRKRVRLAPLVHAHSIRLQIEDEKLAPPPLHVHQNGKQEGKSTDNFVFDDKRRLSWRAVNSIASQNHISLSGDRCSRWPRNGVIGGIRSSAFVTRTRNAARGRRSREESGRGERSVGLHASSAKRAKNRMRDSKEEH